MRKKDIELLTLAEAARLLKMSKTKLYWERKAGKLRTVNFGRSVRVHPLDLRKYISQAPPSF